MNWNTWFSVRILLGDIHSVLVLYYSLDGVISDTYLLPSTTTAALADSTTRETNKPSEFTGQPSEFTVQPSKYTGSSEFTGSSRGIIGEWVNEWTKQSRQTKRTSNY